MLFGENVSHTDYRIGESSRAQSEKDEFQEKKAKLGGCNGALHVNTARRFPWNILVGASNAANFCGFFEHPIK